MENNWDENWDENFEEAPVYETKKSKKIFGIPLAVFIAIITIVVLVAAAVIYNYIYTPYNTSFTKNITVSAPTGDNGSSTQNMYVSIVAQGDISNSILNCDLDSVGTCDTNTGNIMLINSDPTNSHNCTVTTIETDGGNNIVASYTGITSPVTIPASSNVTFRVDYTANVTGSYPVQTTINCP